MLGKGEQNFDITAPATEAAKQWDGWGTALKPAHEPICLAMNPLDGTFAHNALEHGVAGLNVGGGRVGTEGRFNPPTRKGATPALGSFANCKGNGSKVTGRWPANILHDGSEEVLAGFPVTGGGSKVRITEDNEGRRDESFLSWLKPTAGTVRSMGDSGTAARFFKCCPQDEARRFLYCAKASKAERNRGCEGLEDGQTMGGGGTNNTDDDVCGKYGSVKAVQKNTHPTVKPLALMRYLCTLVTMPERNLILDPFAGSGTTGVACTELGLKCILIEQDEHHCEIIAARCAAAKQDEPPLPDPQKELSL
jgi:site-specific DNA-methyltransferase (adenine-specific)